MVKGIGMVPVVAAFQADRAAMALLADEDLKVYLDGKIDVHEWYPAAHMVALLELIARVNLPEQSKQASFEFFGSVAAQRDLQGSQNTIYKTHRAEGAGWYRGAIKEEHRPHDYLRRAFGLYQLYYDSGEFALHRLDDRTVEAELVCDVDPSAELCMITTGYAQELHRSFAMPAKIAQASCRAFGDERCTWTVTFDEGVDVSSLQALPRRDG